MACTPICVRDWLRPGSGTSRASRALLPTLCRNNVKYAEIQVGPQEHTVRGVSVEAILRGMNRAMEDCEASVGIVSRIIITLIKSNTAEDCEAHLEHVLALGNPAHYRIIAAGLAGPEIGYHHSKFTKLMERARAAGLAVITHAGEEGGPEYVADALDSIRAQRIDHGVQAAHDPDLCKRLITENVGLCVCPISNEKLQVYKRFFDGKHPLRALIESGVKVCLGSDDPAFFGGYISDVYCRAAEASSLTKLELWHLAKNSFELALGLPKGHPVVVKAVAELQEMKPLE